MRIDRHLEKLERFESVRRRMDPRREFELWYWMTLSGGTTVINAALHSAGLTDENRHFATQVPDVYAVIEGGETRKVLAGRCDLIHVGLPPVEGEFPARLAEAFDAMDVIERYRDPCIRGEMQVTDEVIADCTTAYEAVVRLCRDEIDRNRKARP
jgi:hypothetical protein